MRREDFMRFLNEGIFSLPYNERAEIMEDYSQHFEQGLARGESEELISAQLGDPKAIAQEYVQTYHNKNSNASEPNQAQPNSMPQSNNSYTTNQNNSASAGSVILGIIMLFVGIVIVLPVLISIIGVAIGGIGAGIAGILFGVITAFTVSVGIMFYLFAGISIVCLSILCIAFFVQVIIWMCKLIKIYFTWNMTLFKSEAKA